ncbi:GMP synthase [Metarhizium album ARSEF 1941]|uniref:GMP synthase n=1 Tax=Metarhizium album (strain ARSEF 1941) TaxID=1081103 RepID=A0A0B2WVK4_METAS|nr:GMP synthase [Metarhizium album ARSEF 1941]KHN97654.1 GMP synthase [Metarhizium album ARSEF 1941]
MATLLLDSQASAAFDNAKGKNTSSPSGTHPRSISNMSQFKDIMKNGWHPEKSGTGIRGSMSGLMGRNKDDKNDSSSNHVARPLSHLKDPESFAPPPKRSGSGLLPAPKPVPPERKVVTSPSKYADPRAGPVEPPPRDTGTGLASAEASPTREAQRNDAGNRLRPYQANTTGLSTGNLPKPPGRRDGADGRSPPSYDEATSGAAVPLARPPGLPPRLPPRVPPGGGEKDGRRDERAVDRLEAAGVSVPALGIGRAGAAHSTSPSPPPASARASSLTQAGAGGWVAQAKQLQGHFAEKSTQSMTSSAREQESGQGTTWAQKQAALETASAFRKDTSSVSLSDAKAAASTANNFRQRHGAQVAAGAKAANNFNQKYGISDKLGAFAGSPTTQTTQKKFTPPPLPGPSQTYTGAANDAAQAAAPGLAGRKKPPPPPPKRKPVLAAAAAAAAAASNHSSASQGDADGPPAIPMSTRPQF